jgi:hypothetical protein
MMKKLSTLISIIVITSLVLAVPVAAQGGGNVKGEVVGVDEPSGTLTVLSNKGETVTVYTPEGFDFTSVVLGDSVLVKGERQEDQSVLASVVKVLGLDEVDEGETESEGESDGEELEGDGDRSNSAFCAEDKQEKPHPMAVALAESFGMDPEVIGGFFCEGNSFGAIMLAYITAELQDSDVASILAERIAGNGWGQIWKGLNLIGSEHQGASPPGLFHRPAHAGHGNPNQE